jgi:hypothetical protein
MRSENDVDWPIYLAGARPTLRVRTANLDGPDPFDGAPTIEVTPNSIALDGTETTPGAVGDALAFRASTYGLRREDTANPRVLIACQPDTPARRLTMALRAAADGQLPDVTFGFLSQRVTDRPLLGRLLRYVPSGAKATVVKTEADTDPGATVVEVDHFQTCAALSKKIVEERWAGHDLALLLPADAVPAASRR